MNAKRIAVFGGTGFLGRHIVRRLLALGFSVRSVARRPDRPDPHGPARHPEEAAPDLEFVPADLNDPSTLTAALAGTWGAVNAVSLYVERGGETYDAVHVTAAERLAAAARVGGTPRFVHVSGIGADPRSASRYIRARGDGDEAVRRSFPGSTIIRPSVLFGVDDTFLSNISSLVGRFPLFPLFGDGSTRLQPVHVEDVAEAIGRTFTVADPAPLYELGGPQAVRFRELVQMIALRLGVRRVLIQMPFSVWRIIAAVSELLPDPPLTRNQVELLQIDNVASSTVPGFDSLGITPRRLDEVLDLLAARRNGKPDAVS